MSRNSDREMERMIATRPSAKGARDVVTATYYGNSNIAKSSASVTQTVHQ
jgi:hypothetical protein